MAFCTQCGASLADGVQFCVKCGARQQAQSSAPASPASTGPSRAQPQSRSVVKILVFIVGMVAFVILLVVAGSVYVGYRVKRKAEQLSAEVKERIAQAQAETQPSAQNQPLGPRAGAPTPAGSQPEQGSSDQSCPALDAAQSQAFQEAASASIPFKPGLTLISIWSNQSLGGKEVEILKTIQGIESDRVTVQAVRTEPGSLPSTRILCIADLLNARRYETYWADWLPQLLPGSTMFSVSRAVFEDLKSRRAAEFEYIEAVKSQGGGYRFTPDVKGQLGRVEPDDVPYSVIVNGERKDLPTIHVKGRLGDTATEAYVIDDPANPIVLNWDMPETNFHIRYLKINFPEEKKIEQQIARTGCAAVYGIYFDFDSATVRSESDPALSEIAQAVRENPTWKVNIAGHTDNIGGDAYNMTLSAHRAEAVKQALITRYQIPGDRLSSQGFGFGQPKAPNDTVEGRALNRRVEVCRQ